MYPNREALSRRKPYKFGRYIAIEGLDGSGKSTLARQFEELGFFYVKHPGATDYGQEVRNLFLSDKLKGVNPMVEMLLVLSDHAHTLDKVILPRLQAGEDVVVDRTFISSLAYQTRNGVGYRDVLSVYEGILRQAKSSRAVKPPPSYLPHMVFFLDASVETCKARIKLRDEGKNRLETSQQIASNYAGYRNILDGMDELRLPCMTGQKTKTHIFHPGMEDKFTDVGMLCNLFKEWGGSQTVFSFINANGSMGDVSGLAVELLNGFLPSVPVAYSAER